MQIVCHCSLICICARAFSFISNNACRAPFCILSRVCLYTTWGCPALRNFAAHTAGEGKKCYNCSGKVHWPDLTRADSSALTQAVDAVGRGSQSPGHEEEDGDATPATKIQHRDEILYKSWGWRKATTTMATCGMKVGRYMHNEDEYAAIRYALNHRHLMSRNNSKGDPVLTMTKRHHWQRDANSNRRGSANICRGLPDYSRQAAVSKGIPV